MYVIVWLEFELSYYDVIDQHDSHYTMLTPSQSQHVCGVFMLIFL